jgi:LPS O-antigen subunit length determinant protein (WzzB/FepE family)
VASNGGCYALPEHLESEPTLRSNPARRLKMFFKAIGGAIVGVVIGFLISFFLESKGIISGWNVGKSSIATWIILIGGAVGFFSAIVAQASKRRD